MPTTGSAGRTMQDTDQIKANYGYITKAKLGQVFSGDPVNGIYGLFAATEIGKVKYQEIFGQNAPDFEIRSL